MSNSKFKHIAFLTHLIVVSNILPCFSQSFSSKYAELVKKKDSGRATAELLKRWETSKPKDPELYIAYFDYYFSKSKKEKEPYIDYSRIGEPISIPDSVKGSIINNLRLCLEYIDRAIEMNPSRLDMRFAKLRALDMSADYDAFTRELTSTIDYNATIKGKWRWKNNKPKLKGTSFLLESLDEFIDELYYVDSEGHQHPNIRKISETVLHHYPNHAPSLFEIAVTYMRQKEDDIALPWLLKAE